MSGASEETGHAAAPHDGESISEVLASIRSLVSSETRARAVAQPGAGEVLMLTPEMRVTPSQGPQRFGEVLTEGMPAPSGAAPILDEAALRSVVNAVVREELQGEMGDRISRNLRKLIRQELAQLLAERDAKADG